MMTRQLNKNKIKSLLLDNNIPVDEKSLQGLCDFCTGNSADIIELIIGMPYKVGKTKIKTKVKSVYETPISYNNNNFFVRGLKI